MKIKELRAKLEKLGKEYDNIDIIVRTENGMLLTSHMLAILKDKYDVLNKSAENTEAFIFTWR